MSHPSRGEALAAVTLFALILCGCEPAWEPAADDAWEEKDESEDRIPRSEMRNPWARAEVGDWYEVGLQGGRTLRLEVIKVSDVEVLVQPEQGEPIPYNLMEEEEKYKAPGERPNVVHVEEKTMEVGGKTIRCTVVTRENDDVRLVNTYSDDLPLDGMVRSVRNGVVHHEVVDFHKN